MKHLISAQVSLKPKSGAMPRPESITSENLESFLPDATRVSQTRAHFESLGFEVGALVGNSFSITATRKNFEQHFHTKILHSNQHASLEDGSLELPVAGLSDEVKATINAVSFSAPPDFGPTNF
jgi:subtilase family serine protease